MDFAPLHGRTPTLDDPWPPPPVLAVAEVMRGCPAPWCIAGGWAIDLFLGRRTREHADVDLAVFRGNQRAVREYLRGWELRKVVAGEVTAWEGDEWLAMPVHEVHARRGEGELRDLELLLNERTGDAWAYRRDPVVTLPMSSAILRGQEGIPVLAPEIVLLYKSKNSREYDARDLAAALPALDGERRAWLASALERVHPGHPWIAGLRDG